MIQDVYGFPLDVAEYQDFRFLERYGLPFHAQARPEDGEVRFGLEGPRYGKLCLRFAGARLTDGIDPQTAVARLREAMPVYEALYPHPALIKLQGHGPAAGGYCAIYRWAEGVPLENDAAWQELLRLPLLSRLRMIDAAFDFHAYAAEMGYVPVGFDGRCLLADPAAGRLTVCGIDRYRRMPAVNDLGRMPGSPRFRAPEEYLLGAPLDGRTAQYALGALAFSFFADRSLRERFAWTAGEALYRIASRACSEETAARFESPRAFLSAWRKAVGEVCP